MLCAAPGRPLGHYLAALGHELTHKVYVPEIREVLVGAEKTRLLASFSAVRTAIPS
jgi:hypothetical protein